MKKPLNYFGFAFEPLDKHDKAKPKKERQKILNRRKSLQKELKKNGFDRSELWNLDSTMVAFIYPRLKAYVESFPFVKTGKHSMYPDCLKALKAFELMYKADIEENHEIWCEILSDKTVMGKQVKEGLEVFGKIFRGLWN